MSVFVTPWARGFESGGSGTRSIPEDVLIRGSLPGPLALFSSRAVDEKDDVDAGVLVAAHCVAGVRNIEAAALKGRKAGRKDERFIVWVTGGAVALVLMAREDAELLEMFRDAKRASGRRLRWRSHCSGSTVLHLRDVKMSLPQLGCDCRTCFCLGLLEGD